MINNQIIQCIQYAGLRINEFQVYLQPQVNLRTGMAYGAEALVRWKAEGKKMIAPDEFIPLFEENGFIKYLDQYIFRNVLQILSKWKKQHVKMPISINLSRKSLCDPSFVTALLDDFYQSGQEKEQIKFEVTESAFLENEDLLIQGIERLSNEGFSIIIDDFGVGYSSLNFIMSIPASGIKLDKKMLHGMFKNKKNGNVLFQKIIEFLKGMGFQVVCEGVEDEEQQKFVQNAGGDFVQGYHFNRPISLESFEKKYLIGVNI